MPKAIIIGAGFGGIAAALRLRKKGYDVTIIDKQDKLGGRAYQYERHTPHGTFIHDAGPTVITAKFLFDELFELFGKKREDYVEFRDIYPWYRIVFAGDAVGLDEIPPWSHADGGISSRPTELPFFDYGGTLEQFEAQIAKFEPADVARFRKFLEHSKKIFEVGFTQLGDQPFDQFTTMLRCAPDLIRLQSYKTVYGLAKKYIKNEKLRRVFSFQPLLVGGNPFNTTSIYSLIFYLERQWGVQFAMGGTGAIVRGLERLMREEGIEIRLGEEVSAILVNWRRERIGPAIISWKDPSRKDAYHHAFHEVPLDKNEQAFAGGVRIGPEPIGANGEHSTSPTEFLEADLVVCNADTPKAYRKLVPSKYHKGLAACRLNRKSKIGGLKYSMGLFVLYFGTTKLYPDVAHHTIVLGDTYRELIEKLFDTREMEREDLSVYLHRPTATDPSMAPPGCDSFYVLVPVPNLQPKNARRSPPQAWGGHSGSREEVPTRDNGTINWTPFGKTFRDDVVRYLERTVLPGLSDCIVDDFYVTPEHFRDNLNTLHGTGFSIQPIFSQSAWFRFHNKAPGIEGLYFVGAGTHPGAGMPGVLCSAKVVDRLVPAVNPAT